MPGAIHLTYTTAILLQTIRNGGHYGFEIMDVTGLPSGTVYPALRRLESARLIESRWEDERKAAAGQRPQRRYYRMTRSGEQMLLEALRRYPLLARAAVEKKP